MGVEAHGSSFLPALAGVVAVPVGRPKFFKLGTFTARPLVERQAQRRRHLQVPRR